MSEFEPNSSEKKPTPSTMTILQSFISGSVAAIAEVGVNHPLFLIKVRMQNGEPFTFNPRVLYRGIVLNAASMVPITGIQVGLNQLFTSMFHSEQPSYTQRLGCAFLAGVGSAFVSGPTERIMTYQSKTAWRFEQTAKHLVSQGGWRSLWNGLPATMIRDGAFTAAFLAVAHRYFLDWKSGQDQKPSIYTMVR